MGRTLKRDIQGPDLRRGIEEIRTQGWNAVFEPDLSGPLRLVVEIGFGRGEFLASLLEEDEESAYVGVELNYKRVLKMARRMAKRPHRNLRIVEGRGEVVVQELLEPESVSVFWVNFPDPWPKKRHAKHRLVQPPFVRSLARRLVPGGVLYMATDDRPYAEQMDEVLAGEPLLENLYQPAHWLPEVPGRRHTAYEDEWRAEGRPLHFFAYRRAGAAESEQRAPSPGASLSSPAASSTQPSRNL